MLIKQILHVCGLVATTVLNVNISFLVKKTNYNIIISDAEKSYFTSSDLDAKLATLPTKAKLKAEQEKIVKLQDFNSNSFCGNSHFEDDGTQNYLLLESI